MKKIAIITSTRAEYGLLYPLIKRIMSDPEISMDLLVSGTHLVDKYGKTIDFIRTDGIPIAYEIPILGGDFVSDERHVSRAISRAVELSSEIFLKEKYDALLVLGDRYELLGFCIAAVVTRLPIIHIHGGEITEGAIDDKIRHSITKLASLHFPSVEEYANRIIQMGENPQYVHAVGALGIDNIANLELLDKRKLFEELDVKTDLPVAVVTYHPVTNENPKMAKREVGIILEALQKAEMFSIITMPNSDVGGDAIFEKIQNFVQQNPDQMVLKKSLGQVRYLSLLKNADIMVGNSSSGILESASFGLPTVDIGIRQKGRIAPANVIHCDCKLQAILDAINCCRSKEMHEKLCGYVNPYGDGHAAERIVDIIKKTDFDATEIVRKRFFDMGIVRKL